MTATIEYENALLDPSSVFETPQDVLDTGALTKDQKIEILERWKYDAAEMDVATEENMGGGEEPMSQRISLALLSLTEEHGEDDHGPHKQKGV